MELIHSICKEFIEINHSIGERLKESRERLGKTQSEFAQIAADFGAPGATRQSQAKYEKGLSTASAAYLAGIAAAGVDVLYILTGERSKAVREVELLPQDERILLDNYRNSPPEARAALKATSAAFAGARQGRKAA